MPHCRRCGANLSILARCCGVCGAWIDTDAPAEEPPLDIGSGEALLGYALDGVYRLDEVIDRGAAAVVYRGTNLRLGQRVAVKVLLSGFFVEDPLMPRRFEAEARAQSRLHHPHIIAVLDFVSSGHLHAIVMEYLEGATLGQVLYDLDGPMSVARICEVVDPLLDAIGYAHGQGVIHRDIKPSNVLLARVGGREHPKMMDFGIAKVLAETAPSQTAPGAMLGTLLYMSPEQCKALKTVDRRSDIYSLGVTLYQMASGMVPFYTDSAFDIMMAHVQSPPPALRSLVSSIPQRLEELIMRALQKDPADRFQDAESMREALRQVLLPEDDVAEAAGRERKTPRQGLKRAGRDASAEVACGVGPLRSSTVGEEVRRRLPDPSSSDAEIAAELVQAEVAELEAVELHEDPVAAALLPQADPAAQGRTASQTASAEAKPREVGRSVAEPAAPVAGRAVRAPMAGPPSPGTDSPAAAQPGSTGDQQEQGPPLTRSPSKGEIFAGWEGSAVQRLRLSVPARAEWERHFDPNLFGGGIFVPTSEPPEVGATVRVEISFANGPRFFVRGMVTWRRLKLNDPRIRAGVGVQVHPGERSKIAYVNSWVRGTAADQRQGRRLPIKLRVAYSARAGRRVNFTRDIHGEGLFLRCRELLEPNTPIRVVLVAPGHVPLDLRGRVTRVVKEQDEQGMGIKLLFADEQQRARFVAFVDDLEKKLLAGELPEEMVS